ncbi:hypothetical protein RND81_04G053000 [Saponaria officinalis]|uniref:Fe2OG dioxygenase domain-containing protein n=1 Tax=Saponaria officinalis TaxID=3572 RepID=A0AAW1LGN2_SAPOF
MDGQIPVIDLQKIQKESHLLREACKLWGCFRLINHGLPFKLMAEMKSTMKALFDRPVEIKRRIKGEIEISGYRPPSKLNPLYEGFSIYDASPEAVSSFCTDLQLTPQQRETMLIYVKAVSTLAKKVASFLAPYNFENWLVEIRPNKYSFTPESIGSHGAIIHTDDGFLTILQDDESIGGLEVMDPSGSFVSVDPALGTFLVNLGDVATGWSNGELRNVQHRVQCKEAGMRLSIAVFLEPPKDTIIEPHPQFLKPNQPLRISPFTHKQLRNTRVAKNLHVGEALYLVRT